MPEPAPPPTAALLPAGSPDIPAEIAQALAKPAKPAIRKASAARAKAGRAKKADSAKAPARRKATATKARAASPEPATAPRADKPKSGKAKSGKARTTGAKPARATPPARRARAAQPEAPSAEPPIAAPPAIAPARKLTLAERALLAPREPALPRPAITLPTLAEALITQAAPLPPAPTKAPAAEATAASSPSAAPGPAWMAPVAGPPQVSGALDDLPPHPALAGGNVLTRIFGLEEPAAPLPRHMAPVRPASSLASAIGAWLRSAASLFRLGLLRRPAAPRRRPPPVPTLPVPAEARLPTGNPAPDAPARASEVRELRAENAELRARLDAILERLERERAG